MMLKTDASSRYVTPSQHILSIIPIVLNISVIPDIFSITMPSLNNSPTARSPPRQNQLGLSYVGLIVVALCNSETRIASDFFPRALTISDIYDFLRAHVRSFQQMEKKEWEKTSRVLRHSLSRTTYFQRFQVDEAGNGKIVATKQLGAGKGTLWTLFPAKGESEEDAEIRIQKIRETEASRIPPSISFDLLPTQGARNCPTSSSSSNFPVLGHGRAVPLADSLRLRPKLRL
ncbi:hypothetical protein L596_008959 [Steinernema carpocapsae]|uniref:Fork-head domain-containing protein n=1 Tax=Steinernema carpocapsae TaxID=34508 RepID=A0A4U5PES8_STECR|nr:hypothetical protein L596_008959 [Steinernema carpocapsae]